MTANRDKGTVYGTAGRVVIVGGGRDLVGRVERALGLDAERLVSGIAVDDLKRHFEGVAQLVVLGAPTTGGVPSIDGTPRSVEARAFRAVLEAASSASVGHLVVVSTAMVYGAWANSPVPLTEAAPLRPVPGVAYAAEAAEVERLVLEWRDDHPTATATVLRPVVTVRVSDGGWLKRSPWVPTPWRSRSADVGPPVQYLLLDDLVSAIGVASRERLDGPFNVAPEGWISGEARQELVGPRPRFGLPDALADSLTERRLRRSGYPSAVAAYTREPWVVASDALRAAGWQPVDTNEQAFVEAHAPGPFASLDAGRRQLVSLAAVGAAGVAVVGGVAAVVRRRRRRRS
jgi:nucleoside-diphosphate-sugar epimerase